MKAKSLWHVAPNKLELREIDVPEPGCKQLVVKMEASGICMWDLVIFEGGFQEEKPFPFYFGHEGVGTVVKTGSEVTRFKEGDRVALRSEGGIGTIGYGHMAEYALQSEDSPIPIPKDDKPSELWVIEPPACCVNGVNLSNVKPGQKIALVGCGYMGSIILQLLVQTPATEIVVFDVRKESLDYARTFEKYPAVTVINSNDVKDPDERFDGYFDTVIESAAAEPAFHLANRILKAGAGLFIMFSWHHSVFPIDLGTWHMKGTWIINASPGADPHFVDCFYQTVEMVKNDRIDMRPLITHIGPPEEAQKIYETGIAKQDGYIKGVITW